MIRRDDWLATEPDPRDPDDWRATARHCVCRDGLVPPGETYCADCRGRFASRPDVHVTESTGVGQVPAICGQTVRAGDAVGVTDAQRWHGQGVLGSRVTCLGCCAVMRARRAA